MHVHAISNFCCSRYSSFNDRRHAVTLHMSLGSLPFVTYCYWETAVPLAPYQLKFTTLRETLKTVSLLLMLTQLHFEDGFTLHSAVQRKQKLVDSVQFSQGQTHIGSFKHQMTKRALSKIRGHYNYHIMITLILQFTLKLLNCYHFYN